MGKPLIENGKNDEVMGEAPPSFFPASPQALQGEVMMGDVAPVPEEAKTDPSKFDNIDEAK